MSSLRKLPQNFNFTKSFYRYQSLSKKSDCLSLSWETPVIFYQVLVHFLQIKSSDRDNPGLVWVFKEFMTGSRIWKMFNPNLNQNNTYLGPKLQFPISQTWIQLPTLLLPNIGKFIADLYKSQPVECKLSSSNKLYK